MTAALEGGELSATRPGRILTPGKTRYPLCRRLAGPQGRSGRAENLAPPGFDPLLLKVGEKMTESTAETGESILWKNCYLFVLLLLLLLSSSSLSP